MQYVRPAMRTCPFGGLVDGTIFVLETRSLGLIVTVVRTPTMIWEGLSVTCELVEGVDTAALLRIKERGCRVWGGWCEAEG
jgi:hypothetical protein